ncbi:TM2 domain-containing protein [bacterium]|nr:TM2 domain-containing protein [bacterium]
MAINIRGGAAKDLKGDKQAPVRLTKEQKMYVENLVKLDNRIVVCREYINLWMQFFRFFAEDLTEKEITPAEEKAFFQVMSQLARKQFMFVELMADKFDRGNDIMNVLSMAVSLAHIQVMPENTRSKLELDWHGLFLDMNKTLGRLLRSYPGNMTLAQALEATKDLQPIEAGSPMAQSAPKSADFKNKWLAMILALPGPGCLGLHMFYLGRKKDAILRLVTLGGFGIWALVDVVMILTGKMIDADGNTLM